MALVIKCTESKYSEERFSIERAPFVFAIASVRGELAGVMAKTKEGGSESGQRGGRAHMAFLQRGGRPLLLSRS